MTLSLFMFVVALLSFGLAVILAFIGIGKTSSGAYASAALLAGLAVALIAASALTNRPAGTKEVRAAARDISHIANEIKTAATKAAAAQALHTAKTIYDASNPYTLATMRSAPSPAGTFNFFFKIDGYQAGACISYNTSLSRWSSSAGTCA
jgi:hypothetical protein